MNQILTPLEPASFDRLPPDPELVRVISRMQDIHETILAQQTRILESLMPAIIYTLPRDRHADPNWTPEL
jgi:hypothetical protein